MGLRIRGGITASILLFVPSPSHGLISLVPWEPTASVADLETAAVNSPRILSGHKGPACTTGGLAWAASLPLLVYCSAWVIRPADEAHASRNNAELKPR